MNLQTISNKLTMSSLEIAELTDKNHADVLRDIRKILDEAGIEANEYACSYLSEQNKELPCFILSRREYNLVISSYSVKYRLAIIDHMHELENGTYAIPKTFAEALRMAADTQELLENKYREHLL